MKQKVLVIGGLGQSGTFRRQRLEGVGEGSSADLVEKVVVLDTNKELVEAKLKQGELTPGAVYTSWGVAMKAGPFDAAFVCTPINTHLEVLSEVAKLGLAPRVLVEKPLALTLEEANQIKKIAEKANLQVFCGYHLGLVQPMQCLNRRLAETGALVKEVEVTYTKMREAGHKKRHPISGVIPEEIPHAVDLITTLMGLPRLVTVLDARKTPIRVGIDRMGYADMPGLQIEEEIHEDSTGPFRLGWIIGELTAFLSFTNQRVATIHSSFETARQDRSLRVEATEPLGPYDPEYSNNFFTFQVGLTAEAPYFKEWSGKSYPGKWSSECVKDETFRILGDPFSEETRAFLKKEDGKLCTVERAIGIQMVLEAVQHSADIANESGTPSPSFHYGTEGPNL